MNWVNNCCRLRQDHQKKRIIPGGNSANSQRICGCAKVICELFVRTLDSGLWTLDLEMSWQPPQHRMPQQNFEEEKTESGGNDPGKQFAMMRELFDLRF